MKQILCPSPHFDSFSHTFFSRYLSQFGSVARSKFVWCWWHFNILCESVECSIRSRIEFGQRSASVNIKLCIIYLITSRVKCFRSMLTSLPKITNALQRNNFGYIYLGWSNRPECTSQPYSQIYSIYCLVSSNKYALGPCNGYHIPLLRHANVTYTFAYVSECVNLVARIYLLEAKNAIEHAEISGRSRDTQMQCMSYQLNQCRLDHS